MPVDDRTPGAGGSGDYTAKDIQVLEGLDPVRKRPGHVHRVHRPGRPAPPHLGGRRQRRRRGDGRVLHAHRRHPARRRRLPGRGQRSRHPDRAATRPVRTRARARPRSCSRCCTPAASSAATATRSPAASTVSASASSTRCPSAWSLEVDRDGKRYRQEYAKGGKPQGKMEVVGPTPGRGRATGTTVTFWPDPTVFVAEGTEFVARTVLERLQTMAFLNRGLEIVFDDERAEKEQKVTYQYRGGLDRLRQAPQRLEGGAVLARSASTRTRTRTARRSTSRSSGTPATTRASTATPTASPPPRAGCTSRASARR